jgi:hypothetical protein
VERGGGRWPVDAAILSIPLSEAASGRPQPLDLARVSEAARLVNSTHDGEDFFSPLTAETLAARAHWASLYGVVASGALVAVAGLWDRGAATERVQRDRATGEVTRSREAAVTDWGWAQGGEEAFVGLLRALVVEARDMGRDALTICEPHPDALAAAGLQAESGKVALFTPGLPVPAADSVRGVFIDMLQI